MEQPSAGRKARQLPARRPFAGQPVRGFALACRRWSQRQQNNGPTRPQKKHNRANCGVSIVEKVRTSSCRPCRNPSARCEKATLSVATGKQELAKRSHRKTHPRGAPALEDDPEAPELVILRERPQAGCAAQDRSAATRTGGAGTPAEGQKLKKPRRGLTATQKRRLSSGSVGPEVAVADPLEPFHETAAEEDRTDGSPTADSATTAGSVGLPPGTPEGPAGTSARDHGVTSAPASSSGRPASRQLLPSPAWRQFRRWVEAAGARAASRTLPAHIRPTGTHQNPRSLPGHDHPPDGYNVAGNWNAMVG